MLFYHLIYPSSPIKPKIDVLNDNLMYNFSNDNLIYNFNLFYNNN